jgi:hypothetical protein
VPRIEREGEGPSSEGERPGHATRTGRICSRRRQARTAQPSSHVTQLPAQLPAGSPHKEPGRARLLLCPPGCLPCPHPRWHLTEAYTLRNTPLHPSRAYGSCRVEGSAESVGDLFSSKRFQPTFWFVASSASGWLRDALQGRRETANSEAISSPSPSPVRKRANPLIPASSTPGSAFPGGTRRRPRCIPPPPTPLAPSDTCHSSRHAVRLAPCLWLQVLRWTAR